MLRLLGPCDTGQVAMETLREPDDPPSKDRHV